MKKHNTTYWFTFNIVS